MWMVMKSSLKSDGPEFCLWPGKTYTIGRQSADFGGFGTDISISRNHAVIRVKDENGRRPAVIVEDLGSKYGTYVLQEGIPISSQLSSQSQADRLKEPTRIESGTRVRFGLQSTLFMFQWCDIKCTSSALKNDEKQTFSKIIKSLAGAELVGSWRDDVTHVVMKDAILTVKVINALARGVPIVTEKYFSDLLSCAQTQQSLPNVRNYVPRLREKSLNVNQVSCAVKKSRSRIFSGKTFVFCECEQLEKYSKAVHYANGKVVSIVKENQDFLDSLKRVINDGQHLLIQPAKHANNDTYQSLLATLRSHGLSAIPETDIGVSILKDSVENECNPRRKIKLRRSVTTDSLQQVPESHGTLVSETADIGSTENMLHTEPVDHGTFRIPPTLTGPSKTWSKTQTSLTSEKISQECVSNEMSEKLEECSTQISLPPTMHSSSELTQLNSLKRLRESEGDKENSSVPTSPPGKRMKSSSNVVTEEMRIPSPRTVLDSLDAVAIDEKDDVKCYRSKRKRSFADEETSESFADSETSEKRPCSGIEKEIIKESQTGQERPTGPPFESHIQTSFNNKEPLKSNDFSSEELSKSYVNIKKTRLVMRNVPNPKIQPSNFEEDLNKPTLNFKPFKKQSFLNESNTIISLKKHQDVSNNASGIDSVFKNLNESESDDCTGFDDPEDAPQGLVGTQEVDEELWDFH